MEDGCIVAFDRKKTNLISKNTTPPVSNTRDKITLPMQDGHSFNIEIDSAGNILYDGHLFIKEPIRIIDRMPIPKAFRDSQ